MKRALLKIWNKWIYYIYVSLRRRLLRPGGPKLFVDLYEQLVEELELMDLKDDHKIFRKVTKRVRANGEADASSVLQLEMLIIDHVDGAELKLRLITLREHLQAMLMPEALMMVQRGLIRNLDAATPEQLRGEAKALAMRVYRRFIMVPVVELQRTRQMNLLVRFMMYLTVLLAVFSYADAGWLDDLDDSLVGPRHLYVIAAYCGALGGAVSVIRRLYQIEPRREPTLIWLSLQHGGVSIIISPVFGAVFALVLVMIVNSGVVSGSLFSNFACGFWRDDYIDFLKKAKEMSSAESLGNFVDTLPRCTGPISQYAKLMLASFLAGWAERFVPDVLEKLTNSNGRFWEFAVTEGPKNGDPGGGEKPDREPPKGPEGDGGQGVLSQQQEATAGPVEQQQELGSALSVDQKTEQVIAPETASDHAGEHGPSAANPPGTNR
jgi:hypothetical protein